MTIENALQKVLGFDSKAFIEKAIEGGWKKDWELSSKGIQDDDMFFNREWLVKSKSGRAVRLNTYEILLDPRAWQAVGEIEHWSKGVTISYSGFTIDEEGNTDQRLDEATGVNEWQYNMHRMIDALSE